MIWQVSCEWWNTPSHSYTAGENIPVHIVLFSFHLTQLSYVCGLPDALIFSSELVWTHPDEEFIISPYRMSQFDSSCQFDQEKKISVSLMMSSTIIFLNSTLMWHIFSPHEISRWKFSILFQNNWLSMIRDKHQEIFTPCFTTYWLHIFLYILD